MTDQFDELAKGLAQSVTRRGALKKFGLGLASIALASLGLANESHARRLCKCKRPDYGCGCTFCQCWSECNTVCNPY